MPKSFRYEELPRNVRGKVKFLPAQYVVSIILVFTSVDLIMFFVISTFKSFLKRSKS